jgi:hypothetical protein
MTGNPQAWRTKVQNRRNVMGEILDRMPLELVTGKTELRGGPQKQTVLWTNTGKLVASFQDALVARFLLDAPVYLRTFMDYIDQVESSAFHDRRDRRRAERRLTEIEAELLAAENLGIHTKDGPRRVRSAIAGAKDKRRFDDWVDD